jgi:hypothetical protein
LGRLAVQKANPTQRRLVKEIEKLNELFFLNPRTIVEHATPAYRTARLILARNQIVRGQIVMAYVLVDEYLNCSIARYFFGRTDFQRLWRRKPFQLFNYHVLEELSLLKKLQFVRAVSRLPNSVREDIERLNALRNGIAHAFFPENLKRSRPMWKGISVFSIEGATRFEADMRRIVNYFAPRWQRGSV